MPKCNRCHKELTEDSFDMRKDGTALLKTCRICYAKKYCEHNRQRSRCPDCDGGHICEHNRRRSECIDCGGSQICEHNRIRRRCIDCDEGGYLRHITSSRIRHALKGDKELSSTEYLCCDKQTLRDHLESQFEDWMNWDNYGEWEIDHIIPIYYDNPTREEKIKRLHYTNLQPLSKEENMRKGNRYIN